MGNAASNALDCCSKQEGLSVSDWQAMPGRQVASKSVTLNYSCKCNQELRQVRRLGIRSSVRPATALQPSPNNRTSADEWGDTSLTNDVSRWTIKSMVHLWHMTKWGQSKSSGPAKVSLSRQSWTYSSNVSLHNRKRFLICTEQLVTTMSECSSIFYQHQVHLCSSIIFCFSSNRRPTGILKTDT